MASAVQITANQANARHSTGPVSAAGKAAVAQNRATHGLSSRGFFLLPGEDGEEFQALLAAFQAEHQPQGPTESFLVDELAQCQWKLRRISAIEAGLFSSPGAASLADLFRDDTTEQALAKLGRYETRIRRDWYRALGELRSLRRDEARLAGTEANRRKAQSAADYNHVIEQLEQRMFGTPAPAEAAAPPAAPASCHSKPMPQHLEREMMAHRRRDPLFDPKMDASQMSKELRKWFNSQTSAQ